MKRQNPYLQWSFNVFLIFFCLNSVIYTQFINAAARADQSTAPVQAVEGENIPDWVNNPYSVYPRDRYITAVGLAANRIEAETRAYAALIAFFGQSIQMAFDVATTYAETVSNGRTTVSENTQVQEAIVTIASLDRLIGAEIGNIWDDGKGNVYALAFIQRNTAVAVYTEIIRTNQRNIDNLTAMSTAEKYTFDGYVRYRLASIIAGMNAEYANIVSLAGGSTASLNLTGADTLALETSNIIRNISVGINVSGDHNDRVRDAFAKVLAAEGLRTQGSTASSAAALAAAASAAAASAANTAYILEANVDMSEVTFPGNSFIFCRYTVSANLIERATGSVLLPFTINNRAGHSTFEAAQARAFQEIEREIGESYSVMFREYLETLLPL